MLQEEKVLKKAKELIKSGIMTDDEFNMVIATIAKIHGNRTTIETKLVPKGKILIGIGEDNIFPKMPKIKYKPKKII